MSGHSKWANIKRKKEANDKVKGNVFAKLSKVITLAVLEGGSDDPAFNVKLRLAVEKAKEANMPKENIARAIEKGSGPDRTLIREVVYEGFAPGGAAFMVVATTDNSNRTFAEVRNNVERHGGKMGSQGSVAYLFQKCGMVTVHKEPLTDNDVFTITDKLQAFDFDTEGNDLIAYFPFENIGKAKELLKGFTISVPEVDFKPQTYVELAPGTSSQVMNLIESVESMDDVQNVYINVQ